MKNFKCSFTVRRSNNTLCWGQSPRLSRIPSMSVSILLLLTCADPEVGGNSPVRMDIVVVLPAPLCPRSAVICPLYMLSVNPSTATLVPVELFKRNHDS
jgi:hypothetical protein